jgi:PII-like signaling protein
MSDSLKHGVFHVPEQAQRLTIYVGEGDRWNHRPLYEAIVLKARELHMAGATVLRGPMGFGADSRINTSKVLRLSEDLPIVIDIVDSPEQIAALIPHLDEMVKGGLVTLEDVRVLIYSPSKAEPGT